MTLVLDGNFVSEEIKKDLKIKTQLLFEKHNIQPGLAVLLVGENPASKVYVNSKEKTANELAYYSILKKTDTDITEEEVLEIINEWNNDDRIHGILVQLPLPKHIDENKVLLKILPEKDVDGFHPFNVGKLVTGMKGPVPCTPLGIFEIMKFYKIETRGKHVVVVGRSNIVGKPIANLMLQKMAGADSIVTICHSAAEDISYFTKQADILIVAIGSPKFIKKDMIKINAVIIDVGINRVEDSSEKGYYLCGDVDYDECFEKSSAITPVPGGIGKMTIAMLMKTTYELANEKSSIL